MNGINNKKVSIFFIKILRNLVLILLGHIFALVFLEFGLRLMGVKPATYLRKFAQYDPILGWSKIPNADGEFRRGDVVIYEKFNSFGLRSPELPVAKDNNAVRILFLGDSFTEGYDVNEEYLFTTLVQKSLQQHWPGKTVEIINGGTGGYSTDQEYLFLKHIGLQFNPDIIILMMYPTNDVFYNTQSRYGNYDKPLLAFNTDTLQTLNVPLPEPKTSESFKNIFRETALYQFTLARILPAFPALTTFLAKSGFVSRETTHIATEKGKAPTSFDIFSQEYSSQIDSAWSITYRILEQMQQTSRKANAQFLVVSIPDRFQLNDEDWKVTQSRYNVNDSIWDRNAPEKKLKIHASLLNYTFINLLDSLKQDSDNTLLYNGVHINEKGNKKVAEILSSHLLHHLPITEKKP